MFFTANFLLLALLVAAVTDLLLALRSTHNLKAALRLLWQQEHYLFGNSFAALRAKAALPLFCIGIAAYELTVTFCNSMVRENRPWVQGVLGAALYDLLAICFVLKILFCTRYTWRSMGVAGCLYFIGRWTYFNNQNIWWFGIILVVFAAKDIPLRRPLQIFLAVGGSVMAVVAALHFAGVLSPGLLSERTGDYRQTFGYGHPNTFGGLLFGLILAWVISRAQKLRWSDVLVPFAGGILLWVGPGSRAAALCSFLLTFLLALQLLLPRLLQSRPVRFLCVAAVPAIAAVSYIFPLMLVKIGSWNTDFGPPWLAKLDGLLTCRLSLSWFAFRYYSVKIAGQFLMDWPPMDNSFVYSLFAFGPVATLLWAAALAYSLYSLLKAERTTEAMALFVTLFYAYMEMQSFHFTTNPAMLLLCGAMFALPPAGWCLAPPQPPTGENHL